jgi:hypothetical protein
MDLGLPLEIIANHSDLSTLKALTETSKRCKSVASIRIDEYKKYQKELKTWYNKHITFDSEKGNGSVYVAIVGGNSIGIIVYIDDSNLLFCPCVNLPAPKEESNNPEIGIIVLDPDDDHEEIGYFDDKLLEVHPFVYKNLIDFASVYLTLHNKNGKYTRFMKSIDAVRATMPKLDITNCTPTAPEPQRGGASKQANNKYAIYNNKKYRVEVGSRGGKYVVINEQKHYIK